MKRSTLLITFLAAGYFSSFNTLNAQCFNCGTGADGVYLASSNTSLAGGVYNYTTFTIDPGVTVSVTGTQSLVIHCTGNVTINGILNASGGAGSDGVTYTSGGIAGIGVAGGADGGNGSFSANTGPIDGTSGSGTGAGVYGSGWSGGGGGGYAVNGQSSGGVGGVGGPAYGNAQLSPLYAGSGGSGGSGGYNCGSGGGGAGGGVIVINSCGTITIGVNGMIMTNGGNGGSDGTGNCGGGGGGSGGTIWLSSSTLNNAGTLSAAAGVGGASYIPNAPYYGVGGNGSDGRVRLDYNTFNNTGTIIPLVGYNSSILSSTTSSTGDTGPGDGTATVVAVGGTGPYTYVWNPGGQTTSTASGLTSGNYTVVVTDASGCTTTNTVTVLLTSGIAVNASDLFGDLMVYPNPANDHLTIASAFISQMNFRFELVDLTGNILKKEDLSANGKWQYEFSTAGLANGFYFIKVSNDEGMNIKKVSVVH